MSASVNEALRASWAALEGLDFFKQPGEPRPTIPAREALLKLLQGLRDEASNAPLAYANPRRAAEYIQSIELEAAVDFFIVDHIRPLEAALQDEKDRHLATGHCLMGQCQEYKAMYEGLCK